MKLLLTHIFFIVCFSLSLFSKNIIFTQEEKDYLSKQPIVTVAMMPDFTPFSYYLEDTPVGFEHDLLKIISKRTGIRFEKRIDNWTTIYSAFKNKEIDMISSISHKEYREPFTTFTQSYYDIPIIVFVRDDFGEYKGLKSLEGKKIGVLKDVFYIKELEKIDTLNLIFYDSYEQIAKDLVFGKIDVLLQNLTNINALIKKHLYTNITIASELILPNTKNEDLRFGIQPENLVLSSIIQKTINSISEKEKEALATKWIGSIKEFRGGHIELNKDEIAYLDSKPIKYCIHPNGMPFEGLNQNGKHTGMSSDYYNLFEKMLSANFELIKTKNWSQSLEYVLASKCSMLALGMETPERKKHLNFTSYYLDVPLVVATRVDVPFINHILDLENEKIGIIKDDAFVKILRSKYPSITLVEVNNIYDGLDKVKSGEHFAYIDTLASIGYEFQSKYFGELKIAGKISESLKLSMAVNKEEKILLNILQKTINKVTNELHREIFSKWIPIKYEKGIDYNLIIAILLSSLFLLLLIIYWNTKIITANKLLKKAKKDIEGKNKELEQLAITDPLTNLYNRRKLEELLKNELNRNERFNHKFCLVIGDIDNFKNINDKYGHQIGDKVLIQIAMLLKSNLRKTDFVARFGGEEFIIVYPESNIDIIYKLIEKVRLKIENHSIEGIKNSTMSFGLTQTKNGDTYNSLIKRADKALYEAKNKGKNQTLINT
ncbi:MAG: diguanylate cyclase [Arcobacter sp.]|nr:MAG: diguanylate cyclase [Arcobacter sp.]